GCACAAPAFFASSRSSLLCFLDAASPEISPLSLHDALPISGGLVWLWTPPGAASAMWTHSLRSVLGVQWQVAIEPTDMGGPDRGDRKSTRLNSSHVKISYAVFCLKKKRMKGNAVHWSRTNSK